MKEGLKMLHNNKAKFINLVAKNLKKQRHEYSKNKVQTDIDMEKADKKLLRLKHNHDELSKQVEHDIDKFL